MKSGEEITSKLIKSEYFSAENSIIPSVHTCTCMLLLSPWIPWVHCDSVLCTFALGYHVIPCRVKHKVIYAAIITLYLNTVPFGENVLGIEAASRRYFNKSVSKLKTEEAAVLVGMLKANTYYNPRLYPENALQRRNVVLSQMKKYNYLPLNACDSLKKLPLTLVFGIKT